MKGGGEFLCAGMVQSDIMANIIIHGNIALTPSLRIFAEAKAKKLERFTNRFGRGVIIRLELSRVTTHHRKGRIFRAEINCDIPGIKAVLVRAECEHSDVRVALDQATEELTRQLEKFRGKLSAKYKKGARELKRMIREERI